MNEITSDGFLIDVSRLAGHLRQGLEGLVADHPDVFTFVRGEGLMLALGCKMPVPDVVNAGYDEHVLVVPAADNVIRLLPPLNMSTEDVDEALWRLDRVATALERKADCLNNKGLLA
jgi:acetylornithine/N-succinyldiaminopimelate aminotransferase